MSLLEIFSNLERYIQRPILSHHICKKIWYLEFKNIAFFMNNAKTQICLDILSRQIVSFGSNLRPTMYCSKPLCPFLPNFAWDTNLGAEYSCKLSLFPPSNWQYIFFYNICFSLFLSCKSSHFVFACDPIVSFTSVQAMTPLWTLELHTCSRVPLCVLATPLFHRACSDGKFTPTVYMIL